VRRIKMNTGKRRLASYMLVLALLVMPALTVGAAQPEIVLAQDGSWVLNPANGHHYRLTEPMPWMDAEAQAVLWGGHLVTLNSGEEESWIKQVFGADQHFWIGFNDIEVEGNWVWVSGMPVVYTNWAEGEPNDFEGEDAAIMNWEGPDCEPPCLGDTWNDLDINGDLRGVVERSLVELVIEIKPAGYPNSINLGSKGVVPVAILTTDDFDAATVDPVTVLFADASPLRWAWEDVDYDGDMDLLFQFKTQELNLDESSTEAMLTGSTFDGLQVEGSDTVNIVP
jgi:hypothetical protein